MNNAARRRAVRRARIWAVVVASLAILLGLRLSRGVTVETGILSLLPDTERDPVLVELAQASSSYAGRAVLFGVLHADEAQAVAAARDLVQQLQASNAFDHVIAGVDEDTQRAIHDLYFPLRHHLLDERSRDALQSGAGVEALVAQVAENLYGPESVLVSRLLAEDPLLLYPAWLKNLAPGGNRLTVSDGIPIAIHGDDSVALVTAVLAGEPFEQSTQSAALLAVDEARLSLAQKFPGLELAFTGLVRFAAAAREGIAREVSIIGLGSLAGVLALILLVFRSLRSLIVGLLPGVVGLLCGLAVSLWVYPTFHALMLIFGASLIGVCIDYSFHFMAGRHVPSGSWSGEIGLSTVGAGITLGAVTSVLAYVALAVTPFPGLRQMALLSSGGLIGAWATVVCWFPLLLDKPERRAGPPRLHRLAGWVLDAWVLYIRKPWLGTATFALLVIALIGLIKAPFDDDVRRLQRAPDRLVTEDELLRSLAGGSDHSRFVLVEAETDEIMLQRQEEVSSRLHALVDRGRLTAYHSLAEVLPSLRNQRADYELLVSALRNPEGAWATALDELGFPEDAAVKLKSAIANSAEMELTPEAWLASEASVLHRPLWLGRTERGVASVVQLEGISSLTEVEDSLAGIEGVTTMDRVADISNLFHRYRLGAQVFVGGAYLLIHLLFSVRYGLRNGAVVMAPPLLAAFLTMAWIGAFAGPLNVMHCLALLLVLGLGVDYAVFFAEEGADRTTTYFALILSALTTMLSFGLLALSTTPAVRAIGLVTLSGTFLALVFAPAAIGVSRRGRAGPPSIKSGGTALALALWVALSGCSMEGQSSRQHPVTGGEAMVEIAQSAFFPLQDPASLGESLAADQSVVMHHAGGTHRFQARFECTPERLVVVGLTAAVGRAFVLILESGVLTTEDHTGGRMPLDSRFMLADIQLAFWPHLPSIEGLDIQEEQGDGETWSRIFRRGEDLVIRIDYTTRRPWDGLVIVTHLEREYRLEIATAWSAPLEDGPLSAAPPDA